MFFYAHVFYLETWLVTSALHLVLNPVVCFKLTVLPFRVLFASAPNNTKLKVILEETERTWNNIANLLSGSEIMVSNVRPVFILVILTANYYSDHCYLIGS